MVRAEQLITLLLAQSKMSSGLKEILRRVDWDHVKARYPMTMSESVEALREIQKMIEEVDKDEIEKLANPTLVSEVKNMNAWKKKEEIVEINA